MGEINGPVSYRALMQETARRLRSDPRIPVEQTPAFDGGGLDAPVFATPGVMTGTRRFLVADGVLEAGTIAGIEAGAQLQLFDRIDAEEPIGMAAVIEAGPLSARIEGDPIEARYASLAKPAPPARCGSHPCAGARHRVPAIRPCWRESTGRWPRLRP